MVDQPVPRMGTFPEPTLQSSRGRYGVEEVDDFIQRVRRSFDELSATAEAAERRAAGLASELSALRQEGAEQAIATEGRHAAVGRAIVLAEERAEETLTQAEQRAASILATARQTAVELIASAHEETGRITLQASQTITEMAKHRDHLRSEVRAIALLGERHRGQLRQLLERAMVELDEPIEAETEQPAAVSHAQLSPEPHPQAPAHLAPSTPPFGSPGELSVTPPAVAPTPASEWEPPAMAIGSVESAIEDAGW